MKRLELTGKIFGRLTVTSYAGPSTHGKSLWRCQCFCGRQVDAVGSHLLNGNTQSCGCLNRERASEARSSEIAGDRFGRLVAIRRVGSLSGNALWRCSCDCGAETTLPASKLLSGRTKSCGCMLRDAITVHGLSKHPLYQTWVAMVKRCHNPSHMHYANYGGRGIVVCDRWRSSLEDFLADVGSRPSPGYSLDRIDNDGDYTPTNVRWATSKEQARNRRSRVFANTLGCRPTGWAYLLGV